MNRASADFRMLDAAGLNLQAVFDLATLPDTVRATLGAHDPRCRQLILIGHAGRRLWECVQTSGIASDDPIDDFTARTVGEWADRQLPGRARALIYPDHSRPPVGLQSLGKLAGWHFDSPFMVGVNARWGSWFAYRAVLLADSDFAPTPPTGWASPCGDCAGQSCRAACPADALPPSGFVFARCREFRCRDNSPCAHGCLARQACPVAAEHRYETAQIAHSYRRSLRWLKDATPLG